MCVFKTGTQCYCYRSVKYNLLRGDAAGGHGGERIRAAPSGLGPGGAQVAATERVGLMESWLLVEASGLHQQLLDEALCGVHARL